MALRALLEREAGGVMLNAVAEVLRGLLLALLLLVLVMLVFLLAAPAAVVRWWCTRAH